MRLPISTPHLPLLPGMCVRHGAVMPKLTPTEFLLSTQLGHDILAAATASLVLAGWAVLCWRLSAWADELGRPRVPIAVRVAVVALLLAMLAVLILWLQRGIYADVCRFAGAHDSPGGRLSAFDLFDRIALVAVAMALLVPLTSWIALRRTGRVTTVGL